MNNLNTMMTAAEIQQLRDQSAKYPRLEHMFTGAQIATILISIPLMFLFGIGVITMIAGYIWYFVGDPYKVRNKKTREIFRMSKVEFKKYKQLSKNRMKQTKSATDVLEDRKPEQTTVSVNASVNTNPEPIQPTVAPKIVPTVTPVKSKVATAVVRVAGTDHHKGEIRNAIKAAREADWFEPYDGESVKDMKAAYRDYFDDSTRYELPQDLFSDNVELNPEPDNKFDENAIAVQIRVYDDLFTIGYVSAKQLDRIHKYVDDPNFDDKYEIITEISGGKSKHVEEDDEDFDIDNPKLKIVTDTSDIYFSVKIYKS